MKLTNKLLGLFVLVGFTLATATAMAAEAKERVAKVVRIKGAARYSTGNNIWQPLKVGVVLRSGAIVQTAKDSYVDITLGDGAFAGPAASVKSGPPSSAASALAYRPQADQDLIRLWEDSVISIDKLAMAETGAEVITETQLDLRAGRVFGTTKKLSAGSRYEVKIPNGVAGIRGTTYTLSADGVVAVLSGSVVVAYTQPDGTVITQLVTPGNQFDAKTGKVTPIADFNQREMIRAAREARIGPQTPATTFVVDQTIYYVSPSRSERPR